MKTNNYTKFSGLYLQVEREGDGLYIYSDIYERFIKKIYGCMSEWKIYYNRHLLEDHLTNENSDEFWHSSKNDIQIKIQYTIHVSCL